MSNGVATRPADTERSAQSTSRALMAVPDEVEKALRKPERNAAIRALLGDAVPMDRFEQIVIQSIYRNPDIQKATLVSLLDAVRVSATLKLEPTGILGEGYLIRYGADAQFEAGYRGLMKLARRSGQVASIDAQVVYLNDGFDIQLGSEPRIDHRPMLEGERGNFRGAYAYARLSTGELIVEWMPDADIQQVRQSSRNGTGANSPWVKHFGEMARKTVLKRLMKRLPLGADAELALRVEAEADQAALSPRPARSSNVTAIHERLGIRPAAATTRPGVDTPPPPGTAAGSAAGSDGPAAPEPEADTLAVSGSPDLEEPIEGDFTDAPAEPAIRCEAFAEAIGRCVKDAGHAGNHAASDQQTWK